MRSGLQAVPQHIWPSAPHAAGEGLQMDMVVSHVSPGLQDEPEQQGCSRSPHATGMVQALLTHARVPEHVEPGQQGWDARPQATQWADEHVKPD